MQQLWKQFPEIVFPVLINYSYEYKYMLLQYVLCNKWWRYLCALCSVIIIIIILFTALYD